MRCTIIFKESKTRTIPAGVEEGLAPCEYLAFTHTGRTLHCRTVTGARFIIGYLLEEGCEIVKGWVDVPGEEGQ